MEEETATMWLRKAMFAIFLGILQFIDVGEAAYRSGYRSYRSYRSGYSYYYNSYYRSYYYYGYYNAGSGSNMTAAIVGGVIGGLFVIAIVVFFVYLRCRYVSSNRRTVPVVITEQPVVIRKREAKTKPGKVIVPRKKKTEPPRPLSAPLSGPRGPPSGLPPSAPPAYDSVYPPSKGGGRPGMYPPPQQEEVPNAFVYKPPF